jgi:hypothetical protein
MRKLLVPTPPRNGHRGDAGDHELQRCSLAYHVITIWAKKECNKGVREVRWLTVRLPRWSELIIGDGDELAGMNSGSAWEKGTAWFEWLLASLLDSNLLDDQQNLAELQRDTQELGVALNGGAKMNSGDDYSGLGRDREIERWWQPFRVSDGGGWCLIGTRGRWRGSWRCRPSRDRHRAASPDREVEDDASPVGPTCQLLPNR